MKKLTIRRMSPDEMRQKWREETTEMHGGRPRPSPGAAYPPRVPKHPISFRIDEDVLAFFRSGGKGYQTRMNAVLRAHMNRERSE